MGIFSALFGTSKMNADPAQQHLARMFIEAAGSNDLKKEIEITNWLIKQPWSAAETRNRIAHAISITKVASVPATYARAKEIGQRIHNASYW
jgi:hypothetical protein